MCGLNRTTLYTAERGKGQSRRTKAMKLVVHLTVSLKEGSQDVVASHARDWILLCYWQGV